ncbi:sensor histidine kinase [Amycolatopsis sp. CA-230715]|uniref:sensor histidine kinase n=1 Tax=Amycolatopsis sp. CA-230715 TaxID=2745196 RepID=UPI001C02F943|nr:nitrate- and nitrite sensing domain-containing protein [Amycolatopsis sp. CA-230715]QWF78641.1 hypothetical protein HUW46_02039 [Amycolatopsis sp. CA-230715]
MPEPSRDQVHGLRNWRLRAKVALVVVLPTVAALFLAGLHVADAFENSAVYERAGKWIELDRETAVVADAVQDEREAMSVWIAGGRADRGALDARIQRSRDAVSALREDEEDVADLHDDATSAFYQQAMTRIHSLDKLRDAARAPGFSDLAVQTSYTAVISALTVVADQFGADVTDRGMQHRHDALTFLADVKEFSAQQNTYLHTAAVHGAFEPAELRQLVTAEANLLAAMDRFNTVASPRVQADYATRVSGDLVAKRFEIQHLALMRAKAGIPLDLDVPTVSQLCSATIDLIRGFERHLFEDAAEHAEGLIGAEYRALAITSAIILAGLLVTLALTYLVARSLVQPLRDLRDHALEVEGQLPGSVEQIMRARDPAEVAGRAIEPVPVHTTEEVGQVARAFDAVHRCALDMAAEQASLREKVNGIFASLSRRSNGIVERQLDIIDQSEAKEQDPDYLAGLFELDHLTTRLRRNAESLLVLSGAGLASSSPKPVPVEEVTGAAVSEAEQYARIEIGPIPLVAVRGHVASDLVHLLAELLDNATDFSEPSTRVGIQPVVTRHQSLAIQIADHGIGMSPDQLAEANLRLADPPGLDVSVTKRMGLYVVARLAKRHGIGVSLRPNESRTGETTGIVARIVVPAGLLAPLPARREAPSPRPVERYQPGVSSIPPVRRRRAGARGSRPVR